MFLIGVEFAADHITIWLLLRLGTYIVSFAVMNMWKGFELTVLLLAKVIAFGLHVAFGQNFGWLNDNPIRQDIVKLHFFLKKLVIDSLCLPIREESKRKRADFKDFAKRDHFFPKTFKDFKIFIDFNRLLTTSRDLMKLQITSNDFNRF